MSLAPSFADSMRRGAKSRLSNALAPQFGVDAKTIRDIWNRKSWKSEKGLVFTPKNHNCAAHESLDESLQQPECCNDYCAAVLLSEPQIGCEDAHLLSLQRLMEMNY